MSPLFHRIYLIKYSEARFLEGVRVKTKFNLVPNEETKYVVKKGLTLVTYLA